MGEKGGRGQFLKETAPSRCVLRKQLQYHCWLLICLCENGGSRLLKDLKPHHLGYFLGYIGIAYSSLSCIHVFTCYG